MKSVIVYVEGGGHKSLDSECREGFIKFFRKLGIRNVQFVPGHSRNETFKKFRGAVINYVSYEKDPRGSWPILFVDSEEVVVLPTKKEHLIKRDATWQFPEIVAERQVQLMTTCMESWLICDKQALKEYFGQCFKDSSLPPTTSIEEKDHHQVIEALKAATRDCGKDKGYDKGQHSFKILARLDPQKLIGLTYFNEAFKAIKGHTQT